MSEKHLLHKTVQDSYPAGFSSEFVSSANAKLGRDDLPMYWSYSLEELKEATNNFDNSTLWVKIHMERWDTYENFSLILQLYKGKLESEIQVVIRCLPLSKKYSIRNFKLRLDLLAKLRHPH
ncbi:hypothetical protein Fmac_001028 [Flemingia macrophylla]|uniref:Uncharacterized protein n=1 Tax=Flemingia macrophylla TaxID=520843 RepID=A0ABD1NHH7_9FABA